MSFADSPTLFATLRDRLLGGLDRPLALMMLVLFAVSFVALYSAAHDEPDRVWSHIRNLGLSAIIALALAQFSSVHYQKVALPLFVLSLMLLMGVEVAGETSKGATRWLNLGFVRIQPSELMKIALPLMLAWLVHSREGKLSPRDWILCVLLLGVPVFLIVKQPDLGTSILVASAGFFVLAFAGMSVRLLALGGLMILVLVLTLVFFGEPLCQNGVDWPGIREYQRQRVCTLLDPTRDPLGKGFHILQSMIAVGSGGIFGKGWLHGTQTQLAFIPERETDFIFSGYAEEFGLVGTSFLLLLYGAIVLRGLWIALGAPTVFGRLLAASLSLVIFTYAFVNLGMVTGILPVVGVPLPFVSYGGTAKITLGIAVGLILSVARDRSQMTQGFTFQRA